MLAPICRGRRKCPSSLPENSRSRHRQVSAALLPLDTVQSQHMTRVPALKLLFLTAWATLAVLCAALPASASAATVSLAHTHMAAKPGLPKHGQALPCRRARGLLRLLGAGAGCDRFRRSTRVCRRRAWQSDCQRADHSLPHHLAVRHAAAQWGTRPQKGSYCTVLYLNGAPDGANGRMPVGWAVGSARVPSCGRGKSSHSVIASIAVRGTLRLDLATTLHVVVRDGKRKPVAGASVHLDGRTSGIARRRSATTDSHGVAIFK